MSKDMYLLLSRHPGDPRDAIRPIGNNNEKLRESAVTGHPANQNL
jgi:hypothetical protein